jgi:hypothetical protein
VSQAAPSTSKEPERIAAAAPLEETPPPAAPKSRPLVVVAEAEEAPVTIPQERRDLGLSIDLEALERAAAATSDDAFFQASDLPPPAKPFLAEKTSSAYRALEAQTEVPLERAPRSAPPAALPQGMKRPQVRQVTPAAPRDRAAPVAPRGAPASAQRASSGRYAPARPASIFSRQKPREGGVFGDEGVVNDKTLDEVILSYLAEDLDAPPRKK